MRNCLKTKLNFDYLFEYSKKILTLFIVTRTYPNLEWMYGENVADAVYEYKEVSSYFDSRAKVTFINKTLRSFRTFRAHLSTLPNKLIHYINIKISSNKKIFFLVF